MSLKERVLLDESHLNGRRANKDANSFLLEVEGGMSYFDKAKKDPNLPIYLVGIIQSGDKPNRNGRIYPWEYLKRECLRYMENEIKNGLSYGELDHPESSSVPSLTKASHTIEKLWFDEAKKDVYGKIKILNAFAPQGDPSLKARSIILNGKNIGISSRALGSLQEGALNGYDVVEEDLEIICWDLVSNASNYGSEKMNVSESKVSKKALLTESQCIGPNCSINNVHKRIQEVKFQELTEQEKKYLDILGVEKFLQIHRRFV